MQYFRRLEWAWSKVLGLQGSSRAVLCVMLPSTLKQAPSKNLKTWNRTLKGLDMEWVCMQIESNSEISMLSYKQPEWIYIDEHAYGFFKKIQDVIFQHKSWNSAFISGLILNTRSQILHILFRLCSSTVLVLVQRKTKTHPTQTTMLLH